MTIARLKRVVLIGASDSRETIVAALQEAGLVHIIGAAESAGAIESSRSGELQEALLYLLAVKRQRHQARPTAGFLLNVVVRQVLDNRKQREALIDDIELIRQHRRTLRPWGDFQLPDLQQVAGYRLWFYQVPLRQLHQLNDAPYPWVAVSHDQRVYYVVVLAQEEPASGAIPFLRAHAGSESLSELNERLEDALARLEELNAEREALTRWRDTLTHFVRESQDHEVRQWVISVAQINDACFVLQAWVPEDGVLLLDDFARQHSLALRYFSPGPEEDPPILLRNHPLLAAGQAIVQFFQLPGYHSWDPSPLITVFFTAFFAMILADAGYALILGILLAFRWRRLGNSESTRAWRSFYLILVLAAMSFGILCGSYFGVTPSAGSWLHSLRCLDLTDFDTMMILSVSMGVIHLLLANSFQARTQPPGFRRLAPWGWNAIILGAFGWWLFPTVMAVKGVVGVGLVIVLICSGERVIRQWRDVGWRLLDGMRALYGISKAFGDVLSYLRLFALGLSSASLAVTFNHLAGDMQEAMGPGGLILSALILLLGHGLNLVLGVMGGVIHGLRLNLLEFYGWGVRGEGMPYQVFRKRGVG